MFGYGDVINFDEWLHEITSNFGDKLDLLKIIIIEKKKGNFLVRSFLNLITIMPNSAEMNVSFRLELEK